MYPVCHVVGSGVTKKYPYILQNWTAAWQGFQYIDNKIYTT